MNTMTMANALKAVFGAQTLTTASYFPACAQDGTPSGVISAANLASVLGVGRYVKRFDANSNGVDTGIGINAGYGGRAILVLSSSHTGAEDHTYAQLDLIRFGYSEDHYTVENIKSSGGNSPVLYGVSSNKTLTLRCGFSTISKVIIIDVT